MERNLPRIIAVEGPIGVGKTTLAKKLASQLNARLILERFDENPFLPLFYEEPDRYSFQTELFFLVNRFYQQEKLRQEEIFFRQTVSDYIFDKCALFAQITLSGHELELFKDVYKIFRRSIPDPELLIYLHAPTEVLMNRISERARSYEQKIKKEYLDELCEIYHREFSQPKNYPIISINTEGIDFRDPQNVEKLLNIIENSLPLNYNSKMYIEANNFLEPTPAHLPFEKI